MKVRIILEQDAHPHAHDRPPCKYPFPDLRAGESFFVKPMRGNLSPLPEIAQLFRVMARYWKGTRGWGFEVKIARTDPQHGAGVRVRRDS